MCVQTPSIEGMDMDPDLELTQKFSCLGATNKDVPISEFQRLLSFQLNQAGCTFFMDMTNWNLQAAIGTYYEFQSPNISAPSMSFVEDVTIGEGESILPDTQFIKLGSRILGQRPCLRGFVLNMLGETSLDMRTWRW